MVSLIEVGGVLISLAALIVAINSRRKQQRLEQQLDRKEEMRELSEKLERLKQNLNRVVDLYEDPTTYPDLEGQLNGLSKDILAFSHATDNPTIVNYDQVKATYNDNKIQLERPEEVLETFSDKEEMVHASAAVSGNEEANKSNLVYGITDGFGRSFGLSYSAINKIDRDHHELLQSFDSNLLEDVESTIDNILYHSFDQLFEHHNGVEFDPRSYDDVQEIQREIFAEFYHYDNLENDTESLKKQIDKIEEIRKAIVQTSYS